MARGPHGPNPKVELNTGKKTGTGGIGYKLSDVKVTGGDSIYVVVEVDDGWFTVGSASHVPVKLQAASGIYTLTADGVYGHTLVKPGEHYQYTAFKLKDVGTNGETRFPSSDLRDYLQNLNFHPGEGRTQTVSVTALNTPLQASYFGVKSNGKNGSNINSKKYHDAHLFNGHGYTFIHEPPKGFDVAYGLAALFTKLPGGEESHLLTLESKGENELIHNLFDKKSGWIGGARSTHSDAAANGTTFNSVCSGTDWYWVTGPSSGKKFWGGSGVSGSAVEGVYTNWAPGQPSDSSDECYVRYGESGTWSTAKNKDSSAQGFYVEFEKLDNRAIGRVSETVDIFNVEFNLRNMTSSNSMKRTLGGMPYETTLTLEPGRELDEATVKVAVGGRQLNKGDYSFDVGTGKLTIPREHVTSDVVITAMAKRTVTLQGPGASAPVTLHVPNETKLDKATLDKAIGLKDGYTISDYTKDGVAWNFQTLVDEDVTLKPQWVLDAPTVTVKPPTARLEDRNASVQLHADAKLDKVPGVTFAYQWSRDGVELPGQTDATLTVRDAGTYTVTVTATDSTTNASSQATAMAAVAAPHQRTVTLKGRAGFESVSTQFTVMNGDRLTKGQLDKAAEQSGYTITKYTKPDGSEWNFRDGVRSNLILHPYYELKVPIVTVTADPPRITLVGDMSALSVQVTPPVPDAKISYLWFRDGASIKGATDATHQTTQWGVYRVEVTVADPRTGLSSKGSVSVTVGAPDRHKVTVKDKESAHVYLTLDVYNGGTVGAGELSSVKKDGHVLTGWVRDDGSSFDPDKDKITSSLTISPVWKPVEPHARPKRALTDTGLAVAAPAVAAALLLTAAGALVAFRRRRNQ